MPDRPVTHQTTTDTDRQYTWLPASALQVAGVHQRFHCIDCDKQADDAAVLTSLGMTSYMEVLVFCHRKEARISVPMELLMRMPSNWVRSIQHIVGFEGSWGVKLRDYDRWLLTEPHVFYGAFGAFRQEQLGHLFAPDYLGGTAVRHPAYTTRYGLDSACFDLVNTEYDFVMPAQFWFPDQKMLRYAQDTSISV